jgi:hypothetical protein
LTFLYVAACLYDTLLRLGGTSIPDGLGYIQGNSVLVFRYPFNGNARNAYWHFGDIRLIGGFGRYSKLGQVVFTGVGQAVFVALFNQVVSLH